jgi:hypothetical protein
MMLDEHGSQGWELSSVVLQETSKIMPGQKPYVKHQKENDIMQTNYFIIFKREY